MNKFPHIDPASGKETPFDEWFSATQKLALAEDSVKTPCDIYRPNCGDIISITWASPNAFLVMLSNGSLPGGEVWCMTLRSGERLNISLEHVMYQRTMPLKEVSDICKDWAANGNSDAMWWLGWYFEGTQHKKSVWYYMAAIRCSRALHGWALGRVISDAQSAVMCKGYVAPDLAFLSDIKEVVQVQRGKASTVADIKFGRWKDAIAQAESEVN